MTQQEQKQVDLERRIKRLEKRSFANTVYQTFADDSAAYIGGLDSGNAYSQTDGSLHIVLPTSTTTTTTTAIVFDTILEFSSSNQSTSDGVTGTITGTNSTTQFQFNAISLPIGGANTMELNVSGVLKIVVDFPDEYLGQSFRFINSTGIEYYDVFTNTTINF